jgi:type I restriction enzyme S subunit
MSEQDATLDEFSEGDELDPTLELGPIEIDLPREWDARELSELFNLTTGNNYSGDYLSEENNGGRIFLTLKSVNKGGGFNWDSIKYYTGEVNDREVVEPGELLIANTDVTQDGDIVGYSVRVPDFDTEREVAASMDLSILRRRSNEVNLPYMEYLLQTDYIHSRMRSFSAGSTVLHLNTDLVESLSLPVPPLEEQRKIASVLYTVDQAIQKTEEIISKLGRVKLGLYQRLFSEGYDQHDSFKSTKYGETPSQWKIKKLSEVTSQIQAGGTPDTNVPEYYAGSIPWIKTGELSQARITDTEEYITEKGLENSTARIFEPGTVLIAMYGATTGEVALLEIEATSNQACCGVVTTEELQPEFLYHQLQYLSNRLESLGAGSGQQNISKGIIEKFDVLVPTTQEQESIVGVLNNVDESVIRNRKVKQQFERLKQGIMQDLLSGEVRTHDKDIELVDDVLQYG